MRTTGTARLTVLLVVLVAALSFIGCAPGKYTLIGMPTQQPQEFKAVEVAKVEVGTTTDDLEPDTPIELRNAIIEAIQKAKLYGRVAPELTENEAGMRIECKIVELENGSQFGRWLIGSLGGKAYLEASCKFINKATGKEFASGTFTGEINGGLFGGSPDQVNMSKQIASAVVKYLKKGK